MDLKKLAGTLLSSDSIEGLSSLTGTSNKDVTSVLTQALPALLSGAKGQADDKDTAESFANALSDHAKSDTSDLGSFLGNIDMEDGGKIIAHLLGSDKQSTIKKIAKEAGVSNKKTNNILSAIGPLLMSLLGQQADEDDNKDSGVQNLIGVLLENVDVADLLTGLLSSDSGSSKKPASGKSSGLFGMLGKLLK